MCHCRKEGLFLTMKNLHSLLLQACILIQAQNVDHLQYLYMQEKTWFVFQKFQGSIFFLSLCAHTYVQLYFNVIYRILSNITFKMEYAGKFFFLSFSIDLKLATMIIWPRGFHFPLKGNLCGYLSFLKRQFKLFHGKRVLLTETFF